MRNRSKPQTDLEEISDGKEILPKCSLCMFWGHLLEETIFVVSSNRDLKIWTEIFVLFLSAQFKYGPPTNWSKWRIDLQSVLRPAPPNLGTGSLCRGSSDGHWLGSSVSPSSNSLILCDKSMSMGMGTFLCYLEHWSIVSLQTSSRGFLLLQLLDNAEVLGTGTVLLPYPFSLRKYILCVLCLKRNPFSRGILKMLKLLALAWYLLWEYFFIGVI